MVKENRPTFSPKQPESGVTPPRLNQTVFYPDPFFQQVLDLSPLPISAVDLAGNVLFASKHHLKFSVAKRMTQSIATEADLYPEAVYQKLQQKVYPKLRQGESVQWDTVVQHNDDVKHHYRFSHVICCDLVSQQEVVFTTGMDITETNLVEKVLSEYRSQVHSATFLDPLTGLANRSLFYDRIHRSLSRVNRGNGHLALLLLDLDNFAYVNEKFGHDFGDLF